MFALVEFTENGAANFESVYERIFSSFVVFQNAQVTGGNAPPPSYLDVTLEGQDQLRMSEVFAFSIQQVATSTTYGIAVPSTSPTGEPATLEEVTARVGTSPFDSLH